MVISNVFSRYGFFFIIFFVNRYTGLVFNKKELKVTTTNFYRSQKSLDFIILRLYLNILRLFKKNILTLSWQKEMLKLFPCFFYMNLQFILYCFKIRWQIVTRQQLLPRDSLLTVHVIDNTLHTDLILYLNI